MNLDLLNEVYKLKELIKSSDEYRTLLAADKKLSESEEVSLLAYKKDLAICDYEDTLKHFNKNSEEALKSFRNLNETIKNMNDQIDVKEYNKSLVALNLMLTDVQDIIFKGLWLEL